MGYAVLHLSKASGTDSAMSSHIERSIAPKNADPKRTHLNQEMVVFPHGVRNRTEAIQHRLDTAGLQRKIGKNQVRAIRLLLTGSPEDMKLIEQNGRLDKWCSDNIDWLRDTYGAKNLVSAVLHLDETTPHIHATIVPITTGERRKKKSEEKQGKKKYRKKSTSNARLCADDVMSRVKLKEYQNSYAEVMNCYGLQRGIDGSKARHVSTSQYYRDLVEATKSIKSDVVELKEQKSQAKQELSKVKVEIKGEKLKSAVVDVGTTLMEGVGSLLGTPKIRRLGVEIEQLQLMLKESNNDNIKLQQKISTIKSDAQKEIDRFVTNAQHELTSMTHRYEHKSSKLEQEKQWYKQQLSKVSGWFPLAKEALKMEELCKAIGFTAEQVVKLVAGTIIQFKGSLYSEEHKQRFNTENSSVQVLKSKDNKLNLIIDGIKIADWFKQQFNSLSIMRDQKETYTNKNTKQRGFKL